MFGSELAWGVVLGAWLLGIACGAAVGGWIARRVAVADAWLVVVLIVLSAAACLELWAFRSARGWLGVPAGEFVRLPQTMLAALLLVTPTGVLIGMAFPLACDVTSGARRCVAHVPRTHAPSHEPQTSALQLGHVYAWESIGSLIGGVVFTFWAVEHLAPIETLVVCGAITCAACAALLRAAHRRWITTVLLAIVAGGALVIAGWKGDALDRSLVALRWSHIAPGYELCAEVESRHQNLAIGRRFDQYTLYSDGHVSSDFPDPYTFVPLAHFWMCEHPNPKRVLMLGGGAEGLLAEVLRYPVDRVDYVEPDARQIELIEPFLTQQDRRALLDPRVTVHHTDARRLVKTTSQRFDLIIARLPEPLSAMRARLYTTEFLGELRRAMSDDAVLCMTAAATPGGLTGASATYLGSIRRTLSTHFPWVTIGWGDPAHILAATHPGLTTIDPAELSERYRRRGITSASFDPEWFEGATDWLDPRKIAARQAELDGAASTEVSTDLRPIVYMQRLELWESATSGPGGAGVTGERGSSIIAALRAVKLHQIVLGLLALAGATMLACYVRQRRGSARRADKLCACLTDASLVLSIASTGLVTMALSIIWLFAFQSLYGYVYQRIGLIIAVFMGGLVIGCSLVNRAVRRPHKPNKLNALLWRWMIGVDLALALLVIAVPVTLRQLQGLPPAPWAFALVEWAIHVLVLITGVLGGAAFPLASGLMRGEAGGGDPSQKGRTAGVIVGADHAGASVGAFLCGILWVPVFGTTATAYLLGGIKLSSTLLLMWGRRRDRAA